MKFFDNKSNQNSNSFMILQSSSEMYCRNEEIYSKSVTGFCSCNVNKDNRSFKKELGNQLKKWLNDSWVFRSILVNFLPKKNPTKSKVRFFYIKYFSWLQFESRIYHWNIFIQNSKYAFARKIYLNSSHEFIIEIYLFKKVKENISVQVKDLCINTHI